MCHNWKKIWGSRKADISILNSEDEASRFLEMKRINGNDITDDISYEAYLKHYQMLKDILNLRAGDSVFEVGCGCGANLYLFRKDDISIGGIDYSPAMLEILSGILPQGSMKECVCGEAVQMPVNIKYDAVFCYGVCQYFKDLQYAEQVLERMMEKSKRVFSIMCVHDSAKERAFGENRRRLDTNYDQRYRDLPKLFYPKQFFRDFAGLHNLAIKITKIPLQGFWNEPYVYDCFFYKE